jgi:phage baseplate assembly protein gpV
VVEGKGTRRAKRPTRQVALSARVLLPAVGAVALAVVLVVVVTHMTAHGNQRPHATAGSPTASAGPATSPPQSGLASGRPTSRATKASSPAKTGCAAGPSSCAYPNAASTGVSGGASLLSVPGQVSKGPGWAYDPRGWVEVSGDGATLQGLSIPYNVDVTASNVTIKNVRITVTGDSFGVSLRHTHNVTVQNSTISGGDAGRNRLMVGVKDIYGDSTGTRVVSSNFAYTSTAVQIASGLIQDNYIHDMGYINGDHINGITANGGTTPLTIQHNSILVDHSQTDAIGLFEDFGVEANVLITGNLLAGGGYTVYGGQNPGGPAAYNIRVINNRFSAMYYSGGGYFGPATAFNSGGPGNVWSGNVWAGSGQSVPSP